MNEQIKKTLDSDSGKDLKNYLISKVMELRDINNLREIDTPTAYAIEVKAQKRAFKKLKEIVDDLLTFSEESVNIDPRDNFNVE